MSQTVPSRLPVFVCYAHTDNESPDPSKRWLDRLLEQLAPLAIQDQVSAWSDKDIETGQDWHDRIHQTLKNTKAAVLLVSPAFLASTYIRNSELPVILKNAKDRGVVILPVIVRHCLFKETTFKYPDPVNGPEELSLATLQSANSPTTPLNSLSEHEQDKVLLEVAQSLLKSLHQSPSAQTSIGNVPKSAWNVPLERNPFFTGREDILGEIHEALLSTKRAAFSGLGGIGKTQTAVEYAYRHKDDYSHILWVKAESKEYLTSDFAQLASVLDLREKQAQDQQEIVKAVQRWLQQHDQWLLILDNADDLSLIQTFIHGLQTGHILLTTRAQATGTISGVEVRKLPDQEGVAFLLRRAKLITKGIAFENIPPKLRAPALALVKELDGLPLALDQAGAYIEATQCGLPGYLELYATQGLDLLKERGLLAPGHPDPVATTWVLSFQKIEWANPAAAELLTFWAFLHPDGIPEELITDGAHELGPVLGPVAESPILLNMAIGEILKFSLIHRDMNNKTLDIHRLVQSVIQKSIDNSNKIHWIDRFVRVMNRLIPSMEYENWNTYDRFLSQGLRCGALILTHDIQTQEASRVLHQIAYYLTKRARYLEAGPLYQLALTIRERVSGPTHPLVGNSLNDLAALFHLQGNYAQAEPLYQRALSIREQELGSNHLDFGTGLSNLAILYADQGKYEKAAPISQRALTIAEQALGPTHPDVATRLNNLATIYHQQGKFAQAEPLHQRALSIRKQVLGSTHPDVSVSLNNLALLYSKQAKYSQAEPLLQQAIKICEETVGPTHPNMAFSLNNLAGIYQEQGKFARAETLYQRARTIWEQALGPNHPDVATSLNNLAWLYHQKGKFAKAEPFYRRALGILEKALGSDHPTTQKAKANYEICLKRWKVKKIKRP